MVGLDFECAYKSHVSPLQIVTLYPDMEDDLHNEVTPNEPQFMVDYDYLTDLVDIGDIFAVIVGEDNVVCVE